MKNYLSWVLVLGLAAAGCDDGTDSDAGIIAGDGGADGGDATDAGPGEAGDGNDTFADADPVTLGEVVQARINPAGDLDYFTFEGTEGDWIVIDTTANPDSMDGLADTVVTLFDSGMNRIAENDDGQPRTSPDSELITRLPATGTYYVLVQEFSSWERQPNPPSPLMPEGGLAFLYDLNVSILDPELNAVNVDAEPNDDAASAQNLTRAGTFGVMAGSFTGADTDVYRFVMAANPNPNFFVMPIGIDGYGAPALPTSVWVTNMDGSAIVARLTPSGDGTFQFDPSLPLGTYNFHVSGADGGSYVIKSFIGGDNPPEAAEATNGDAATPEMLSFSPDEDDMQTDEAFVLAQLPVGDTDYFAVTSAAGDVLNVSCGSRTSGSGIQDLRVEVTSADGATVLGMATETETENAFVQNLTPPAPGDYRVRLTRGAQISDVTGTWVRCGIRVGPMPSM